MGRKGENIYTRKDGRWEGRAKIGCDSAGKTKYRSVYARSYQAVKAKLNDLKASTSDYVSSGRMTVGELFEEWLSSVKIRAKPSTYANYRLKADKHIWPEFAAVKFHALTVKMLNDFVEEKLASRLSPKYVSDIVVTFKSMAKYVARIHNFRNPIADAVLPKVQRNEPVLLDDSQQKTLCRHLKSNVNSTTVCVMLSLYTGLRIGEICGLMWSDIDLEKSILTVRRTVQRICHGRGTHLHIGTPKSRSSRRIIPIPKFLLDMLKDMKGEPNNYVLSGTSAPIEPRTMQNRFKSILKKVNLPSVRFHALRHMFATNCLRLGFDVKTLSELLGHSSAETTLNRYVHSSMERKTACMEMLNFAA